MLCDKGAFPKTEQKIHSTPKKNGFDRKNDKKRVFLRKSRKLIYKLPIL